MSGVARAAVADLCRGAPEFVWKEMTLVVARVRRNRLSIVADTMVSAHGTPLATKDWVLKSICLPGDICVSYSGSPELAAKAFQFFRKRYPLGANYEDTIRFFEADSAVSGNDFIIAFAKRARIVTVRDGSRKGGVSNTHWIGDHSAFERFREYESRERRPHWHRSAVNAALFADEMEDSPASDLYSVMNNVAQDSDIQSVGGFVTVLSNRDKHFRFSVYSDVLLDWPAALHEGQALSLTDKIDLLASGENDRFSVNQISSGYYNMNAVAFYVLKGRLLFTFREAENGETRCTRYENVEPNEIASTLDAKFGFPFRTMCLVMSGRDGFTRTIPRTIEANEGLGLSLYCEVNTMPNK